LLLRKSLDVKLTRYTDYGLRVLMHLAAQPDRHASIAEMARIHRISHNHLMKVVHDLRKEGFLTSVRGRSGGVRLARSAETITIGEVVRHSEDGFNLVDCGPCVIAPACSLNGALQEALRAFMDVLDRYSLADVVAKQNAGLAALLAQLASSPAVEPALPSG
jgi:Rrf2 family nitric oxide-sensitive transcriptional repressor